VRPAEQWGFADGHPYAFGCHGAEAGSIRVSPVGIAERRQSPSPSPSPSRSQRDGSHRDDHGVGGGREGAFGGNESVEGSDGGRGGGGRRGGGKGKPTVLTGRGSAVPNTGPPSVAG